MLSLLPLLLASIGCAPSDDDTGSAWVEVEASVFDPGGGALYWRADSPVEGPVPVQLWVEMYGTTWQADDRPVGWLDDETVLMAAIYDEEVEAEAVYYVWVE